PSLALRASVTADGTRSVPATLFPKSPNPKPQITKFLSFRSPFFQGLNKILLLRVAGLFHVGQEQARHMFDLFAMLGRTDQIVAFGRVLLFVEEHQRFAHA